MRKGLLILFLCVSVIGVSACGVRGGDAGNPADTAGSPKTESAAAESTSETENEAVKTSEAESVSGQDMTGEEMLEKFHEKFYAGLSDEEMERRVIERSSYCQSSSYNEPITHYWENIRGVTDISPRIDPLFFTDMKYYSEDDFQDASPEVIHVAKNEIYARHGYIFKDEDLYNYFMGCIWYQPQYSSEEFSDSVFNEYEQANLKLLKQLDS